VTGLCAGPRRGPPAVPARPAPEDCTTVAPGGSQLARPPARR